MEFRSQNMDLPSFGDEEKTLLRVQKALFGSSLSELPPAGSESGAQSAQTERSETRAFFKDASELLGDGIKVLLESEGTGRALFRWAGRALKKFSIDRQSDPLGSFGREGIVEVFAWLAAETDVLKDLSDPEKESQIAAAGEIGRAVYATFMRAFDRIFSSAVEKSRGRAYLRRRLERHFGFVDEAMLEAADDRVRTRRRPLLRSFKRNVQPSLYTTLKVDEDRIDGFFVRVAELESKNISLPPVDGPQNLLKRQVDLNQERGSRGQELALCLRRFYESPLFTPEERAEALLSFGLAEETREAPAQETDVPPPTDAAPASETRARKLSRVLGRLESLQEDLRWVRRDPSSQARKIESELIRKIDEATEERDRLKSRIREEASQIVPRPRHVEPRFAEAFPNSKFPSVRAARIRKEIELMKRREIQGRARIESGEFPDPPELARLVPLVATLLNDVPRKRHGSDAQADAQYRRDRDAWDNRCEVILGDVSTLRSLLRHSLSSDVLLGYLDDLDTCLRFGVREHTGVTGAIQILSSQRTRRLLRTPSDDRSDPHADAATPPGSHNT
jgi:hypothetical protein